MPSGKLLMAAIAAMALSAAAHAGKLRIITSPAPPRPAGMSPVSDPAEPPLRAEVAFGPGKPQPVTAAGLTLRFDTTGSWQGTAGLTFTNAAPPMRFTLTLARMPAHDLESVTLTSGRLSLAVGPVSSSPTRRYFDALGRPLVGPEGAAYTVTARRWAGELDVQVRRAPGAALGKALSVSWRGDLGQRRAFLGDS